MALKARILPKFPARVVGDSGMQVVKTAGVWYFRPNFGTLSTVASVGAVDITNDYMIVYRDTGTPTNVRVSFEVLRDAVADNLDGTSPTFSATTITSNSSTAFTVGPNGTTAPTFQVAAHAASQATGWLVSGAAETGGANLTVISTGTNENGVVESKGTGTLTLNLNATGVIRIGRNLVPVSNDGASIGISGQAISDLYLANGGIIDWNAGAVQLQMSGATVNMTGSSGTPAFVFTSTSSACFIAGPNGSTNPTLSINCSVPSAATGWEIVARAAAGNADLRVTSSGTDEGGRIDAKGAGTLTLQNAATGIIVLNRATTVAAAVATPAGGSTAARLLFGTTAGFGVYYGSGAPSVSAGQGSLYLRSDGSSTSTRLYVNTTGSTTWTNFTSAT